MASVRNVLALNDPDPKEMTIVEHLEELRGRLIICLLTVTVGSIIGFFFLKGYVWDLLVAPMTHYEKTIGARLVLGSLTDPFVIEIKMAIAVGIAFALPVLLYQGWMFVAPAVSVHARQYAVPFVLLGIALFIVGVVVGYLVFPLVVRFLLGQAQNFTGAQALIQISSYVGQFALVLLVFGVVFEMPVVMSFLAQIGIISSRWLRSKRKQAGILALICAMIITPGADPITPFVTACVVYLLYEFSIIMVRAIHR